MHAQLVNRHGVGEQGLKLLLDEVAGTGDMRDVMLALLARVDAAVNQVELETHSKPHASPAPAPRRVRAVLCPQRRPQSPSDFDAVGTWAAFESPLACGRAPLPGLRAQGGSRLKEKTYEV